MQKLCCRVRARKTYILGQGSQHKCAASLLECFITSISPMSLFLSIHTHFCFLLSCFLSCLFSSQAELENYVMIRRTFQVPQVHLWPSWKSSILSTTQRGKWKFKLHSCLPRVGVLFLLHRVGAILPTDSHMFLMRADPGTVIILILHLKSITSRANSSGGNPVNPQPSSFMLNSPSTAGLKPRISVQRGTLASELKHSQQFVQALGRWPTQEHP